MDPRTEDDLGFAREAMLRRDLRRSIRTYLGVDDPSSPFGEVLREMSTEALEELRNLLFRKAAGP